MHNHVVHVVHNRMTTALPAEDAYLLAQNRFFFVFPTKSEVALLEELLAPLIEGDIILFGL